MPQEWNAWLHHAIDTPPIVKKKLSWFKDHSPNLTGSPFAYEYKDNKKSNKLKIYIQHGHQMNNRFLTFFLGVFTVVVLIELCLSSDIVIAMVFMIFLLHLIKSMGGILVIK